MTGKTKTVALHGALAAALGLSLALMPGIGGAQGGARGSGEAEVPRAIVPEDCAAAGCSLAAGHYHLRLPEGEGPHPAVVLLHNAGEDAAALADDPVLAGMAVAAGYAVIVPQGLPQRFADGNEVTGWRLAGTQTGGRDDLSFLSHVLADASEKHGIDAGRVLLTGHGLGASLTWEAACLDPLLAAAYAPRNGGFWGALPEDCTGPIRLLHVHAPVANGWPLSEEDPGEGDAASRLPVQAHLTLARESNGCGESAPIPEGLPDGHDGLLWQDCDEGADIRLVLHRDAGQTTARLMAYLLNWSASGTGTDALPGGDNSD
ncbi:MAG: hypothetical protein AAF675_11150 [Pseudomonadota bacterium]